ncbi:MAG TPA: hypothetical protein VED87_03780, partial [Methylocystis sp.]|nr:hypothetical protein [Methylocystis sp.]
MLRSRSAVLALAALVIGLGAVDARAARRNSYSDEYSVDGLGLGDPVVPSSPQYKRYKCEASEQYEAS